MPKGQRWYKNWKNEGFPRWLRDRMEERGFDTVILADKLGTRYTSGPTRWLSGQTIPSHRTLKRLAEVFELPLEEVYKAAGHLTENGNAPEDDPRVLHLVERIRALDLTHERYMALSAFLTAMEQVARPEERPEHVDPGASAPPLS